MKTSILLWMKVDETIFRSGQPLQPQILSEEQHALCILFCAWRTVMPLPRHGRSASLKLREISLSDLQNLRSNRSSQRKCQTNFKESWESTKSPAMKTSRRVGGFADCRARLPRLRKCLRPSLLPQKLCFPWHRKHAGTWDVETNAIIPSSDRTQDEWLSSFLSGE